MKTVAIIVKDGLGFIVSLEATLQTKEQVLAEQITARKLTNHERIIMLL